MEEEKKQQTEVKEPIQEEIAEESSLETQAFASEEDRGGGKHFLL